MLKSFIIISWRNLVRSKGFSLINISGLSVGMAVAILITLWVYDEITANRTFPGYENIGEMRHNLTFGGDIITHDGNPYGYGEKLKSTFAEVSDVAQASILKDHVVSMGDRKFSRKGWFVDPSFVDIFSVKTIAGSHDALKDARSIMINQTLAKALAGDDAIGKMVRFDSHSDFIIAAVFEDFPSNSKFSDVAMLLPMAFHANFDAQSRAAIASNENFDYSTFIVVNEGVEMEEFSPKIRDVLFNASNEQVKSINPRSFIFPMDKWNLYNEFKDGENTGGKIQFVWMFSIVGAFVLLLACINFVNLSTARAERRAKEVGVRKVMGSMRQQLFGQFLCESFMIVLLAFVVSIAVVSTALPWYNALTEKLLVIPWNEAWFVIATVSFMIATGFLAGSYPALYLSSFRPVVVLKGSPRVGHSSILSRKSLVVFQFGISIVIIICTLTVFQQISHTRSRPVGFDLDNLIFIQMRTTELRNADYNLLRNDLLATGIVENMATSDFPITGGMSGNASTTWPGKDPAQQPLIAINKVSHDFPKTNGFQFIEGRDFSRDFASDSSAVIINEMAAELIAPGKSAIGVKITWGGQDHEVIGVIKDQIRWGPAQKQTPHVYNVQYNSASFITIKFNEATPTRDALAATEAVIKKYDPGAPFDYTFVDEDYGRLFKTEQRIGNIAAVFATLAIFISCIGMLGLASFAASQRIKEIGIRKVLGASVFNVWKLLSSDFVLLVIVAIAFASPVAWYFSNEWLSQYDYRIDVSPWTFVWTGIGVLFISLATVSYQAIGAAIVNPVKSLRAE